MWNYIQMKMDRQYQLSVELMDQHLSLLPENMETYTSISMEEAKEAFAQEGSYIIVDVRRADEYAQGHIPGAINIANEEIIDDDPVELSDKDQLIYVYCRSGRRSQEAAAKLAALGYSNVIECGGIMDWTGEIEESK